MENRFDDLTKGLAEGMSRRQAFRRLGSLFGGAVLASLAFGSRARANGFCGSYGHWCPKLGYCVQYPSQCN